MLDKPVIKWSDQSIVVRPLYKLCTISLKWSNRAACCRLYNH